MEEITIKQLLAEGVIVPLYPVAINATPFVGPNAVSPHIFCSSGGKCKKPVCQLEADKPEGPHICPHGLSYYKAKVGEEVITVYGIIARERADQMALEAKSVSKASWVHVRNSDVSEWLDKSRAVRQMIERRLREREELGGVRAVNRLLHDVPVMIRRAKRALEQMTPKNGEILSEEMKALHKNIRLASDLFNVARIWTNPESASYGQRRDSTMHRVLYGVVASTNSDQEDKALDFQGKSSLKIGLYDSFNLLPLMLVRNAVKYNIAPPAILEMEEISDGLKVCVRSYGPMIEDNEKSLIFERDTRGKWAEKHIQDGQGLGLYVAQVVARAHGTEIAVNSKPDGKMHNGIPMAQNEFSFVLHQQFTPIPPNGRQ